MPQVVQSKTEPTQNVASDASSPQQSPMQLRAADYATGSAMLAPPLQMKQVGGGPDLARVQEKLNSAGFDCGPADGIWGPKTRQAVVAFQASQGLTADGIIGSQTLAALEKVQGTAPATPTPTGTSSPGGGAKVETPPPAPTTQPKGAAPDKVSAPGDDGAKTPETANPVSTGEQSEAERLRNAIAGSAEEQVGKDILKPGQKEEIRKTMPNYTTCIDFAGNVMRGGVAGAYGQDVKKAQQTAVMLSQIKGDWEKAVGANTQAAAFQDAVARYDKAIAEVAGRKAKVVAEIEHLRRPAEPGEGELVVKQRNARADILEKQALGQYDAAIRDLEKHKASWQAKADKKSGEAAALDAKNAAMIKVEPGMTNGRPKRGEYIITAAAKAQGYQIAGSQTKSTLHAGAFKHIAVFMGHSDLGNGMEEWSTIDGGGDQGKKTTIYVQPATALVYRTPNPTPAEPGKPWTGTTTNTAVAGWIDTEQLIAMRNARQKG